MSGHSSHVLIHAICTFHRQWLPGDTQGWRSRGHKRHSSGDYKARPPEEEHKGLRRFNDERITDPAARLLESLFATVGAAFVWKLNKIRCPVRVVSCGTTHLHALFEMDRDRDAVVPLGKAKQYASLKKGHQGQLWAEGAKIIRIGDDQHARNAFAYICDHATKEDAWVWRGDRDAVPARPK